jgi:hypothetical protein
MRCMNVLLWSVFFLHAFCFGAVTSSIGSSGAAAAAPSRRQFHSRAIALYSVHV